MNQSPKLSLFLGLGCKPMKDVVLHHPLWTIFCGNSTMEKIEKLEQVKEAAVFEMQKTLPEMVMSIEAIPERLTLRQASENYELISLSLQDTLWKNNYTTWWEEIEASYD